MARTIAKQVSKQAEAALSTIASVSALLIFQTLSDLDPEQLVMSINCVGTYDLISSNANARRPLDGGQHLPFMRWFCGSPSTCLWEEVMGVTQDPQERGERIRNFDGRGKKQRIFERSGGRRSGGRSGGRREGRRRWVKTPKTTRTRI